MNRTVVFALSLVFSLAACGSAEEVKVAAEDSVPKVSLKDSCPKVEATLPEEETIFATTTEWEQAAKALGQIAEEGDVETKNAVESLQEAYETYLQDPAQGQPSVEALDSLLAALDAVANRCKIAGSTALQ